MNYKDEYIKLKQYIMKNKEQHKLNKLNPLLINEFFNLYFVVNDDILDDEIYTIILSLIEEFCKIISNGLRHNIELSQYYAMENNVINNKNMTRCENCEVVLRYIDTTICVTNSHICQPVSTFDGTDSEKKSNIGCDVSKGLIRFYIKQLQGNQSIYTKIHVVKIQSTESLQPFMKSFYQNVDEIKKLENVANIAISRGQTDAFVKTSQKGILNIDSVDNINCSIQIINNIIHEAKNKSVESQLNKMTGHRIFSEIPTQASVNAANIVAETIMTTDIARTNDISVVLVPGNEPMLLYSKFIGGTPGVINESGITPLNNITKNNAAIAIDSNLAVIPTKHITDDPDINISDPFNKISASIKNKLVAAASTITKSTENAFGTFINNIAGDVGSTAEKVVGFITGKPNPNMSRLTVVPVNENLNILTKLYGGQTFNKIPVPQTTKQFDPISKNTNRHFNNGINTNNLNEFISIDQMNQAARIVKNGINNTKRIQNFTEKIASNVAQNKHHGYRSFFY